MNYQRMLGQLANIEWNMSKSRRVAEMNEVSAKNLYSKWVGGSVVEPQHFAGAGAGIFVPAPVSGR
jgi:hypothetical protein